MEKRRLGEHIKKQVSDCRGVTLVELIVTFALIGLFMTAATSMLTSTLKLFTRMQATSRAITVSDMLLDKIAGEITAAIVPPENSTNGYYFWLQPKSVAKEGEPRWVVFRNRSKSPIAIFAAEAQEDGKANIETMGQGELFIRYYSVSEHEGRAVHELDWHFDSRVYMGYSIDKLWFEQEYGDEHPNVVKIHLTLRNPRTGFVYSTFRYAENYNYDFASNYMCERTETEPGIISFPVEADEFRIKGQNGGTEKPEPKPEPEPEPEPEKTVGYTLYFFNEKKESIRPSETRTGVIGTQVQITLTPDGNDEMIQIIPPDIENYEFEASKSSSEIWLDELEDKNNLYLYYKLVNTGNSITVTDSDGNKHTLYPNLDWEVYRKKAANGDGYYTADEATMFCDNTGFYIVVNGLEIPKSAGNWTLEQYASQNNKAIKITETTRIYTASDVVEAGEKKWKNGKIPKRGELAFFKGKYYIAPSDLYLTGIPPAAPWIKLPVN